MKRITIGRSQGNDVVLGDMSVSRRHAELRTNGSGRYFLIDLDSTNGTFVRDGGQWVRLRQGYVSAEERLQIGDVITTLETLLDGHGPDEPDRRQPDGPYDDESEDVIDETPPPEPGMSEASEPFRFRGFPLDPEAALRHQTMAMERDDGPRWLLWLAVMVALLVITGGAVFAVVELWDDVVAPTAETTAASAPAAAATNWMQRYGTTDHERGHGLTVTPAGSLVVAASRTVDDGSDSTAAWLLGLGADGTQRWSAAPAEGASGKPQALAALPDGSVLAAGSVQSEPDGSPSGWAARVSSEGASVWARDYGTESAGSFNAALTVDGGFVLAGASRGDPSGDGWLVKLDGDGGELWSTTVGGPGGQAIYDLAADGAGGFYAAGVNDHDGAGAEDGWLVRLDGEGEVVWETKVGGAEADYLVAVAPVEGGAVAAGRSRSDSSGDFDLWVVWVDEAGTVIRERRLGGAAYDAAAGLAATDDGGVLVAGVRSTGEDAEGGDAAAGEDGWLLRLDAGNGETTWERTHGGEGADRIAAVAVMPDGRIVTAGHSASGEAAANDDLWVLKLDTEGRL